MSSTSRRISILRVLGWTLRLLAALLLVLVGLDVVYALPNLNSATAGSNSVLLPLIQQSVILLIAVGAAVWLSGHFFVMAKDKDESLNERLLGYVQSTDMVSLDVLAGQMVLTQKEAADRLAKLVSQGLLKDRAIDLQNQRVVKTWEAPQAEQPVTAPQERPQAVAESDETIRVKAKLYELEVLRQQGKISQKAYDNLKEDYEKKLAQADKGTQVY